MRRTRRWRVLPPVSKRRALEALRYQAERVSPAQPQLIDTFRMEDEFIDSLKRIYSLSKRLAKLLLPTGRLGQGGLSRALANVVGPVADA